MSLHLCCIRLIQTISFIVAFSICFIEALDAVWAVNCGGPHHIDSYGIEYNADPLEVGVASDYGKSQNIDRVSYDDQILYQTERFHTSSFVYHIPTPKEGDYVLTLKFSEVWFNAPNQKVFDVVLNNHHHIVASLDIFRTVGRGVAHDELIEFKVRGKQLIIGDQVSSLASTLPLQFVKGALDNPKVNAIVMFKGQLRDVPKLPDRVNESENLYEEDEEDEYLAAPQRSSFDQNGHKQRKVSGPKLEDPYASEFSSVTLLSMLAAAAASVVPIAFCICKL